MTLRWFRRATLVSRLTTLLRKVEQMTESLDQFKADLQARLDKFSGDNAALVTAIGEVKAELSGLRQQVADLTAQGVDASVLQPLLDTFDAQTAKLEAATADLAAAEVPQAPSTPSA